MVAETIREAYASIQPIVATSRVLVLRRLALRGEALGFTSDELEHEMGWPHQSVSPRLNELLKLGHVTVVGDQRYTRSGRRAFVYRISEDGRAFLRQYER